MSDHMYLPVTDMACSRAFSGDLLKILGIEEIMSLGDSVGFGVGRPGAFWIVPRQGAERTGGGPVWTGLG